MSLYNQQGRCTYTISEDGDCIAAQWSVLPGFLNGRAQGLGGRDLGRRSVSAPCGLQVLGSSSPCQSSSLVNENGPRFSFQQTFSSTNLVKYSTLRPFHLTQCFCPVEIICELSAEMGKWMGGRHLSFEQQHKLVMTAAACGSY